MSFPSDFRWGVATSSYQIEGAAQLDGRGPSVWDTFARTPGKVVNGENGDIACDHYHRYLEDIAIMKDMGVDSYRFSIAWPRLFPDGSKREQRGFDFYSRLVDGLLDAGIEPMVTLYHWDLPQTLQDKKGWANRDVVPLFTEFASETVKPLGDRVTNWLTLNEPWCFSWLGYMSGVHAPGVKDASHALAAAHHSVLAHAEASRAMRAIRSDIRTGIALNMTTYRVADPHHEESAKAAELLDAHINRWWLDAAFHGHYPKVLVDFYGDQLDALMLDGDAEKLKVQTDIVGVNYYCDSFVAPARPEDKPINDGGPHPFPQRINNSAPKPYTDMGWPITPQGLHELLVRIKRDWPEIEDIAITENGAAFDDGPGEDGVVRDARRVEYLRDHINSVRTAIEAGSPVKSYFAWSLLDNFEWAEGYAKRFGLVHVDFDTLRRTPKDSARFYSSVIDASRRVEALG